MISQLKFDRIRHHVFPFPIISNHVQDIPSSPRTQLLLSNVFHFSYLNSRKNKHPPEPATASVLCSLRSSPSNSAAWGNTTHRPWLRISPPWDGPTVSVSRPEPVVPGHRIRTRFLIWKIMKVEQHRRTERLDSQAPQTGLWKLWYLCHPSSESKFHAWNSLRFPHPKFHILQV